MSKPGRDFIAEAIADYDAMKAEEQGKLVVQILEDQPILMGFITNLSDDFSESEHEVLVDSAVILINAFVSAGIPVEMISHQLVEEVIREKVDEYEEKEEGSVLDEEQMKEIADSPLVFEDLKNRAIFKSNLPEENLVQKQNFGIVLDTIISMVERSVADQFNEN